MFETFYGFTGSPFLLNPDPAFFFKSKGHSSAYAHLKYGAYQGEGFIVITGDVGAGKTTLVRALVDELDTSEIEAATLVSTQLEADDLLRSVAAAFGVPVKETGKATLLANLEAYLTTLVTQRRRALLIVDEAQNLSAKALEELRMLSNFQLGTRALLQSFLVGQPELRSVLRSPSMQQLRQRVVSTYHLGPLDAAETEAYVQHRLRHVGWKDDPKIEPSVYKVLHQATGGIPRRINNACSRLLLLGFVEEKHELSEADARRIAAELATELGPELIVSEVALEPAGPVAVPMASAANTLSRQFALSSLVARLDRIERSLAQLHDKLRGHDGSGTQRPQRPGRSARNG